MRVLALFLFFGLFNGTVFAGTVDTVEIFSAAMQKSHRCLVILPDNYSEEHAAYPVVYLLHGYSGNYGSWQRSTPQLPKQADHFQLILVCPDGGYDSWYLDSPVDSTVRYETYISSEVVSFIDAHYHTRKTPAARAIAGLSMGGHGAVYLAARNPDVFGAAGSLAGGLDLRQWRKNNWDLAAVLGDPVRCWNNWEVHSAVNLVKALKKGQVQLIIDCGVSDFFLQDNRLMHQRLLEAAVPHTYTERPGGHNGEYWGNAIDYQLVFFDKFFRQ